MAWVGGRARRLGVASERLSPILALAPAFAILAVFFYGFICWTIYISFTTSRMLPRYEFAGLANYRFLLANDRWGLAYTNLLVFAAIFIVGALVLGFFTAVLVDRAGSASGFYRTLLLYPLSISWLATGLLWQWLLNPSFGIERSVRDLGFTNFTFDWLVGQDTAIYTLVFAALWHMTGLVMAIFLAGLRGIDDDIWRATRIEGIPTWRVYIHVILPMLRPYVLTVVMLLSFGVVRLFDLVIAMTGGGPGFATDMPALFMYDQTFTRSRLGVGAASAVMILLTTAAVIAPYLYLELRKQPR